MRSQRGWTSNWSAGGRLAPKTDQSLGQIDDVGILPGWSRPVPDARRAGGADLVAQRTPQHRLPGEGLLGLDCPRRRCPARRLPKNLRALAGVGCEQPGDDWRPRTGGFAARRRTLSWPRWTASGRTRALPPIGQRRPPTGQTALCGNHGSPVGFDATGSSDGMVSRSPTATGN